MTVQEIKGQLSNTWAPFFSRFGQLTEVQQKTIPRILAGKSVVVSAPTASGKTEAVVAPAMELASQLGFTGLHTIYIVPTRALANDLLDRLEGPLSDMGIRAEIKHGDRSLLPQTTFGFLITTPESIDSLLCRRPELFESLHTVIIDEVHLVDSTPRGDQLRILLNRVQKIVRESHLVVHILSATVASPMEIRERYSPSAEIVAVQGSRRIDLDVVASDEEMIGLAKHRRWRKILYFCNYRSSVEKKVEHIARLWDPYPVIGHHGRKSRNERIEAEQVMKEANAAICVATSTLEIGIDVGNIDVVVFGEVPWSVSSFVQRAGRANRRSNTIHTVAIVSPERDDGIIPTMVEAANQGVLERIDYESDKSVAVQQIYSILFGNPGGLPEADLADVVLPLCSEDETRLIMSNLRRRGLVEDRAGHVMASTHIMDLGEKGMLHSTIPDYNMYKVVRTDSHETIGQVYDIVDRVFFLDGHLWQTDSIQDGRIEVTPFEGELSPELLRPKKYHSQYWKLLPAELR